MKHFNLVLFLILFSSKCLFSQDKKMSPEVYDIWNDIEDVNLSKDGQWISYDLVPGKGDPSLKLYNTKSGSTLDFKRASNGQFDHSSSLFVFRISPSEELLDSLKNADVKEEDLPADTLGIYNLDAAVFEKVNPLKSFSLPEKEGGLLAVLLDEQKDSTAVKKQGKKNGYELILYNTEDLSFNIYNYILEYEWSEKNGQLAMLSTGSDSINNKHLMIVNAEDNEADTIMTGIEDLHDMTFNNTGDNFSFTVSTDSTDIDYASIDIYTWNNSTNELVRIAGSDEEWLADGWRISPYSSPFFSKNSKRLYFATHKLLPEKDTTIDDSDKAEVEIWNWNDGLLYTQQEVASKREKERSYMHVYDFEKGRVIQVAGPENEDVFIDDELSSPYILSYDEKKYEKYISWIGYPFRDVFLVNLNTGEKEMIAEKIQGRPTMSPEERFVYWYNRPDTSWYAYNIATESILRLSQNRFYDELNDRPMHPRGSGSLGWTKGDSSFLVYDHYDIWKINPENGAEKRLTSGREDSTRYRHIEIDREVRNYPADTTLLLRLLDETDKSSGYAYIDLDDGKIKIIEQGPFNYTYNIQKAENANTLVFTKESFELFPDLILTNPEFSDQRVISNANPQQAAYGWGSIELFRWKDYDGQSTDGLLVKPPNFDPSKKYPVMVNFYEKSSNRLHNHRAPYPGRSSINYSYWANKGYVIFNPDVRYKVGYPGQSCYDAVMSGLDALIKQGFVDETKIGLQGHSWGGYQIADLITRTDRFACAEAGAPVVNMISAYGGIRWGSGRSRMFQYEQTQSRLGATPWDNLDLYIENSPLFRLDKVTTPVLILHNDDDGAVPWYQGIEYFVAMRRLGKPAWLLNYNGEPHGIVKRENRLDFHSRLEQFFDHYLMGTEMPVWMKKGVPAHLKEYEDGLGY